MIDAPVIDLAHIDELRELESHSPNLVAQLVRVFLNETVRQHAAVTRAFEKSDAQALSKAVHSLRNSALAIGTPRLAHVCLAMEHAAHESFARAEAHREALDRELAAARAGIASLILPD